MPGTHGDTRCSPSLPQLTTSDTPPACLASWAEMRSPVRTISIANDLPTARVSLWVPPAPIGRDLWSQLVLHHEPLRRNPCLGCSSVTEGLACTRSWVLSQHQKGRKKNHIGSFPTILEGSRFPWKHVLDQIPVSDSFSADLNKYTELTTQDLRTSLVKPREQWMSPLSVATSLGAQIHSLWRFTFYQV